MAGAIGSGRQGPSALKTNGRPHNYTQSCARFIVIRDAFPRQCAADLQHENEGARASVRAKVGGWTPNISPLAHKLVYQLDRMGRSAPTQEFDLLFFQRICCNEKLLQLLDSALGKIADVLQITLEGRAIRHSENAIVLFLLAFAFLADLENPIGLQRSTTPG